MAAVRRCECIRADPLSAVRMAAGAERSLVLQRRVRARTAVLGLRHRLEHVLDERPLPGLPAPVALDIVPPLPRVVAARRLVRVRIELRPASHNQPRTRARATTPTPLLCGLRSRRPPREIRTLTAN